MMNIFKGIQEKSKKLRIKNAIKVVADVLNKHWICKTIILFIPSIYMPIIIGHGKGKWGLSNNDGILTVRGWIVTVCIYVSVLLVNILVGYKAKRDKEDELTRNDEYENEIAVYKTNLVIYDTLMHVIGNVCDAKFDSILSYIDNSVRTGHFEKPFNETMYPDRQLKNIAKEIKNCISTVTEAPFNNITVSMAVEFPEISKTMRWIDQNETMQCMKLDKLKKNNKTVFHQIYMGKSEFLFYNDKVDASKENKYVLDNKDHKYNDIGSILCEEISIEEDNITLARLILSISTYGYRFTDSKDEEILKNISDVLKEVILHQFEKRIKIELSLLYIKKKYNSK